MRLLIVDDEIDLCEILRFNFESEGYEVDTANSGEEALEMLSPQHDLMLLDVMMDRMSGFDVAKKLRNEGNNIPIIFLTARTAEADQLEGFDTGADDYITKPFSAATVLARVKAVLKRTGKSDNTSLPLQLDESQHIVYVEGQSVLLTKKEFLILKMLLNGIGHYFTREQILSQVWDDDTCVTDRSVDVHIARLRKKLGAAGSQIVNRSGLGYTFQLH